MRRDGIEEEAMRHLLGIHARLRDAGYTDKEREIFLMRLLLCFFAERLSVFGKQSFFRLLEEGEGSVRERFACLFRALGGCPAAEDPEEYAALPCLSRELFREELPDRGMDGDLLLAVLACREVAWEEFSPALFGVLFQETMNQLDRREWGAYYTPEEIIDRVIGPLFLDELEKERENCRGHRKRLLAFQEKLCRLAFLDPACGCGNFLIRLYERLRLLELSVVEELGDPGQRVLDISLFCHLSLGQFRGIEQEASQAEVARICLWLSRRKLDLLAAERFGLEGVLPAPLSASHIRAGNALEEDWRELLPENEEAYIVGNPPFAGARLMTPEQKADMKRVFRGTRGAGNLDYVSAWYRRAAERMAGTGIRTAFVSTNSICQGEQASLLWKNLTERFGMEIDFARQTFVWEKGGRDQAKVHCVIVGFSDAETAGRKEKLLFSETGCERVKKINSRLTEGEENWLLPRKRPLAPVPEMVFGSMANDGGHLILHPEEREELQAAAPESAAWIRPFLGAEEFLNGRERYCLWVPERDTEAAMEIPMIRARAEAVAGCRQKSRRESTRELAEKSLRFGEIRQPEEGHMILVPRVSSWRRNYIPMGFSSAEVIASDAMLLVPCEDLALFALLTSGLHMRWVRAVAGRLKSDLRYSASLVYNNFPFPELTEEQRGVLAKAGERILRAREQFPGKTLAQLYAPEEMPGELRDAHGQLDVLTEQICGVAGRSEEQQLKRLFDMLREMEAPILKKKRGARSRSERRQA